MPANPTRLLRLAAPVRPDRELLRAHLAGDPAAIDELVRRYAELARRTAAEVCPTAADDVAQAALALLARRAADIADRESAAGWVFETARRLALKARTATARRAVCEAQAKPPQPSDDPLDSLTLREVRAAVADELARLPDELRLPLVLCYWAGTTRPAAASRLGCSVSTLKRRLDAGRDRLAERLKRRGFAGPAVLAALTAVQAGAGATDPVVGASVSVTRWKVATALVVVGFAVAGIGFRTSAPADDPPAKSAPPQAARPAPPVDRYGDPLPDGAVARFGTVRFRHGGQLHSVAYSPDGKTIASGGFGRIMLWEAATGKPLATLVRPDPTPGKPPRHGQTFGLGFSLGGKRLVAVGSPDAGHDTGLVTVWDVAARNLESVTEATENGQPWFRSVATSADGKWVAYGTDGGTVQVVDAETQAGRATAKLNGAVSLAFAPDGKTLAVATYKNVVLLDPETGNETGRFAPGNARQVAFAPDGLSLWIGCDGDKSWKPNAKAGTLSRWDIKTAAAVQTFDAPAGMFLSLAGSPDGKTVASGGTFVGPLLWDAATGKHVDLAPSSLLRPWVHGLSFAPDGTTLAVADTNGRVRVWDVAGRRELHRYDEHTVGIGALSLSPDGRHAATGSGDCTVRIWDMTTGQMTRTWTADDKRSVFAVAYTPDGRSLLTSGWDGHTRLWDVATAKEVRRFGHAEDGARSALSPDGKLVAASGKDGIAIHLYETATGRLVRELAGHVSYLMWLRFSPDGRRLVSAADGHHGDNQTFADRSIRVWDVETGKQLHKLDAGRPHGTVAISPDGKTLAAGVYLENEKAMYLRFWDMATGQELADRRVKEVGAVAFSPDGKRMATADRTGIRLVESANGRLVRAFENVAGVYGLTFTPDGRRLLSHHDDGTALVWDVASR